MPAEGNEPSPDTLTEAQQRRHSAPATSLLGHQFPVQRRRVPPPVRQPYPQLLIDAEPVPLGRTGL